MKEGALGEHFDDLMRQWKACGFGPILNCAHRDLLKPLSQTPGAVSVRRSRERLLLLHRIADALCDAGRLHEADDRNDEVIQRAAEQLLVDYAAAVRTNGGTCDPVPLSIESAPDVLFRKRQ